MSSSVASSGGGAENGHTSSSIENVKSWLKDINPLYGDPFFPEAENNCGSCSYAVYKRLNGDNQAVASLNNIGTDAGMERALGKKCVYASPSEIESYMKSQGAGFHTVCGINRQLPDGSRISGHWFNIFYDGNQLYTIDGQSGEIYDWPHDYGYISEWCILK